MLVKAVKRRRKGVISLQTIDYTITAETSQPTVEGSTVRFAKRPGTCVRCHKQWRRDHEIRPKYYGFEKSKKVVKVSPETRLDMIEQQDWRCLICDEMTSRLYLDHCHSTGKIRGMLCLHCNSGLGSFRDDPERLSRAIEYLKANR
ncbi:MAG: hypothetical protein HC788_04880 [Sphingopyxis sp.]|nr:hypothetical protein [Sphingopyxis sp.]